MRENIRLLEDRVAEAARRLKRLSDEKATANREVSELRKQLASLDSGTAADDAGGDLAVAERLQLTSRLREALDLLREE